MSPTSRYPTISVVCDAFATMVALVLQLFKSTCDGGESANCTSGSVAVVGQVLDRLGEHGDIGVAQNLQRLAVVSVRSGASSGLGACLLNPGEMGFEPLKPVGEPDAANSRIRFDVRVEALRPSFVAPFPRWRSSAGCECGKGRGPPLGELQDIVGEADEAPLVGDLLDAAQEKLTEAARLLDLSEHRLGQLLS